MKSKEDRMKEMLGLSQNQLNSNPAALADKNPTFENETAAGLSFGQSNQNEKALVYFERALQHNPNSAIANNNMCSTYNSLQEWDKAQTYCEKALKIAPDLQLAKNNLKFTMDRKADNAKFIAGLKAKVDAASGSDRRGLLVDLGFEYYKIHHLDEAIQTWKKVEKKSDDTTVRALNNLGSAYILMKKFDLAKASLNEAEKIDPKNQLVKNNLAWLKKETAAR